MNTNMADGAAQRLVAEMGQVLFGQPGLNLMELAEKVKGMTEPNHLQRWSEVIGQTCIQPSPAGQGDALDLDHVLSLADVHAEESREDGMRVLDRGGLLAFAQDVAAALDAREPVGAAVKNPLTVVAGQAVAWMTHHDEPMLYPTFSEAAAYCDDDEPPIPLYAAMPEQAVDLGPVREALQAAARSLRTIADSTKGTEFLETAGEIRAYAGSRASCAEQALIDCKAVG